MAMTEADRALRQLVERWREEAKKNMRRGVNMACVSTREYFGGVNYGLGQFTCADELDAVLAARVQEEETP